MFESIWLFWQYGEAFHADYIKVINANVCFSQTDLLFRSSFLGQMEHRAWKIKNLLKLTYIILCIHYITCFWISLSFTTRVGWILPILRSASKLDVLIWTLFNLKFHKSRSSSNFACQPNFLFVVGGLNWMNYDN